MTIAPRRLLIGAAIAALSSPVFAHHPGPSGVGQGGSSIEVIGPGTLEAGKAAVGVRVSVVNPDDRSDAELVALAGHHIHAHQTDYNLNAGIGVAYGMTGRLTLSAELPYVRRDDLREGTHAHSGGVALNGVEQIGSVSGIGDASIIAKYRLTGEEGPGLALIGGIKMPTGSTHKHSIDGERLETEHQPGSGSWDPIVGAAFGTPAGPLRINASAIYQWSGKGAQDTRLGDRFKAGIALSHHFGPAEHEHAEGAAHHHDGDEGAHQHEHAAPHGHNSWDAFLELTGEWEGRQEVAGEIEQDSGGKSVWLAPGAQFNSASGFSVGLSVGVPVWQHIRQSHPDNDYRATLAIGRAF